MATEKKKIDRCIRAAWEARKVARLMMTKDQASNARRALEIMRHYLDEARKLKEMV